MWRGDGFALRTPGTSQVCPGMFLHWDFIVQLCRGSSEGDISVAVAGGPLAVSI